MMDRMVDDLSERLSTVGRRFEKGATVFCTTAAAAAALLASGKVENVQRIEAHPAFLAGKAGRVAEYDRLPLQAESVDLVVSLLALQEMNDVPGALIQIRRALRPDGLFLGAMAGAGSLAELRESLLAAETEISGGASPRVIPFADVRDAGGLLQRAGLSAPRNRYRDLHSAIRYDVRVDQGLARDGSDECAARALAAPGHKAHVPARRGNLCGALLGRRWARPRHVFFHLDVRLGSARLTAKAVGAGFGRRFARKSPGRRQVGQEYIKAACVRLSLI